LTSVSSATTEGDGNPHSPHRIDQNRRRGASGRQPNTDAKPLRWMSGRIEVQPSLLPHASGIISYLDDAYNPTRSHVHEPVPSQPDVSPKPVCTVRDTRRRSLFLPALRRCRRRGRVDYTGVRIGSMPSRCEACDRCIGEDRQPEVGVVSVNLLDVKLSEEYRISFETTWPGTSTGKPGG